ncbi:MAG: hypothetical protein NTZ73_03210 [Candidatus Diapherotrites archaeon]|nr:hypothetical protein [Candidatus Diapherotrites archaeon]
MKKSYLGIMLGIVAGIIDVILMLVQGLTWNANLSAFSLWVVSGFLIATSDIEFKDFKIRGGAKGVLISFLVLLPSAILIGWKEPFSLIPIFVMTLILGALSGFIIDKYGK